MRGQCHPGAIDDYHKKSTELKTKTCNAINKKNEDVSTERY